MNIEVWNISSSAAMISWTPKEPCQEDHYHVTYKANWNTMYSTYFRNSFHYEEKVPRTVSRALLEHLAPSTFYFLCISCKKLAYPQNHYCTMFYTPAKDPMIPRGYMLSPKASLWVLLGVLMACAATLLVFTLLHYWCKCCQEPRWSYRVETNGLVRWPQEGPAPGREEEEQQGLPLVERPRRDSGAGVEPEAAAAAAADADANADADRDPPDAGAPQREGGGQPGILPHLEE